MNLLQTPWPNEFTRTGGILGPVRLVAKTDTRFYTKHRPAPTPFVATASASRSRQF